MEGTARFGGLAHVLTERFAIGAKLVSEWLTVHDLARLDSAFCCTDRDNFLQLIALKGVYLNCHYGRRHSMDDARQWLLIRQGKVQKLCCAHTESHSVLERYLSAYGKFVRELTYNTIPDERAEDNLLLIAQHCRALDRCCLIGQVGLSSANALFMSCRSLTSFDAWFLDIDVLVALAKICTHLRSLDVGVITGEITAQELSSVERLHDLQDLRWSGPDCLTYTSAMCRIAASCSQLRVVSLQQLSDYSAMAFARHCPLMEVFHASLADPISPAVLDTIADCWRSLCVLLLQHKIEPWEWTDAHNTALVKVIQLLPKLTNITYVDNDASPYLRLDNFRDYEREPTASGTGISPLLLLWVPSLSVAALSTVLARCPGLTEVITTTPAEPEFLAALAASDVTSVGFCWSSACQDVLGQFSDLLKLRVWDIGPGAEKALTALAARSPSLYKLSLSFNQRPSLCLFPNVLRHTPDLDELNVGVLDDPVGSDSDGEGNEKYTELIRDAKKAMFELVQVLCPYCRAIGIKL